MNHILVIAGAISLILGGAVMLPLPIPLGAPMLAGGLIMLISVSPAFARLVARSRRRWRWCDAALSWIEARAPESVSSILRTTRSS